MAKFDAELYLRLIGEEILLDATPDRGGWSSPLEEAAGALIAIGAISATRARSVAADYNLAQSLRSRDGYHHAAMRAALGATRGKARALKVRRVVALSTVIEDSQGRLELRYAVLGDQETALACVYRPQPDQPFTRHRRGMRMMHGAGQLPWGAPAPTLSDDRDNSATLGFSGGGSEIEWTGRLSTDAPLAADTHWLELDGHRLELDAVPSAAEVHIEELPETDPARRYLWQRLAVADRHGPIQSIDPALEALLAAGALALGDPVIDELQAVRARLPDHPHHNPVTHGIRNLPEPWRSLLRRVGKDDGPSGRIVLGARTPLFDGHRVGILTLESDTSGFRAEVEMTPGEPHTRFGGIAGERLTWWARDDRGNNYLGSLGGWRGGSDYCTAEIEFWPALDPRARRLELCPTTAKARAVIGFELQWSGQPPQADQVNA